MQSGGGELMVSFSTWPAKSVRHVLILFAGLQLWFVPTIVAEKDSAGSRSSGSDWRSGYDRQGALEDARTTREEAKRAAEQAAEAKRLAEEAAQRALDLAEEAARKSRIAEEKAHQARVLLRRTGSSQYDIAAIAFIGDRAVVHSLEQWDQYEESILEAPISDRDIETIEAYILGELQAMGYIFASISSHRATLRDGILAYQVHVGEVGEVEIVGAESYSDEQVRNTIKAYTGRTFNYRDLSSGLYALNVKPDVVADMTLDPRQTESGSTRVDVTLEVDDRLPIHAGLTLSNTGTQQTDQWRLRTDLQHLNLTKHDDTLSFSWLTSPADIDEVTAFTLGYYRPLKTGRDMTLFVGWSESEINDVLPSMDVRGEGVFAGATYRRLLSESTASTLHGGIGWTYQGLDEAVNVGPIIASGRDVDISMLRLEFEYAAKTYDRWGGRNFIANTVLFNFEDQFGSSGDKKFQAMIPNADGNLIIDRFQAARLQQLKSERWTMFARIDGQYTQDTLIPALQQTLGGADRVRGFEMFDTGGDSGFTASLELRTPLLTNFLPGVQRDDVFLESNPDFWGHHRLQFLSFVDAGFVKRNNPAPGLRDSDTLSSAGLGMRLNFSKYAHLRFDYGFPFKESDASSSDGRGHLSLNVRY